MRSWGDQDESEGSVEQERLQRRHRSGVKLSMFRRELRGMSPSERATRDLLADVVYRVRPEWLDDVVEVALANLDW